MGDADRVRIAVIGAGGMANQVHYPSLASFPDVDVVAAHPSLLEACRSFPGLAVPAAVLEVDQSQV